MEKNTKRLAIGTLVAGGIGYLAGILTAPKSGKETRQDVKNVAIKAKLEAEKELKKLYSEVSKQLDRAKELGKKLKKEHKADLDKAMSAATNARIRIKQLLTNLHEGDVEDKDLQKALKDVNEAVDSLKAFVNKHSN